MELTSTTLSTDLRVRRHFDEHVGLYVDKELVAYQESCLQRIQMLTRATRIGSKLDALVLDVGCGGGLFADILLNLFPSAKVLGLDTSEGMIRQNRPSKRKHLVLGDARRLPEQSRCAGKYGGLFVSSAPRGL